MLVLLGLAACADSSVEQVQSLARRYAKRAVDSVSHLPADSLPDSAAVDTVGLDWTSDEWMLFWQEVEKERARLRPTDTVAQDS